MLRLKPDHAHAHNNLGAALLDCRRVDEAVACFRAAVKLTPDAPEACNNMGRGLLDEGRPEEAAEFLRKAVRLKPDFPEAHNNLGSALKDLGQFPEALNCFRQALALNAGNADAQNNLGNILQELGQVDAAIAAAPAALELRPASAGTYYNLGNALRAKGRLDQAIAAYHESLRLAPAYADALNNLGNALKDKGFVEEAIAWYRRVLVAKPDAAGEHGNLLLTLNYLPDVAPPRSLGNTSAGTRCMQNRSPGSSSRRATSGRRALLRVGYVSPDFYSHSVAYFIEGLLASHDRAAVEVFCYAEVARPDHVTTRLQGLVRHWHDIHRVPDAQAAELIRGHGIDILVDLAGHTAHNRLLLLARKPAPVQVTWLGYANTTGMSAIDYRLTDACRPALLRRTLRGRGGRRHPLRRDSGATPRHLRVLLPGRGGAAGGAPCRRADHVRQLSYAGEGQRSVVRVVGADTRRRRRIRGCSWWRRGLTSRRVERVSRVSSRAGDRRGSARIPRLQAAGGVFRIAPAGGYPLDSHPFTGHTIACHALWMGVPVVTLAGQTHRSRMVTSVLTTIGLPELVAHQPEEYVRIACGLAADLPRLRATPRDAA